MGDQLIQRQASNKTILTKNGKIRIDAASTCRCCRTVVCPNCPLPAGTPTNKTVTLSGFVFQSTYYGFHISGTIDGTYTLEYTRDTDDGNCVWKRTVATPSGFTIKNGSGTTLSYQLYLRLDAGYDPSPADIDFTLQIVLQLTTDESGDIFAWLSYEIPITDCVHSLEMPQSPDAYPNQAATSGTALVT